MRLYEYTNQGVTVIIQATNRTHAFKILQDKLRNEGLKHTEEDVNEDDLIDITSNAFEVVAFFNYGHPWRNSDELRRKASYDKD